MNGISESEVGALIQRLRKVTKEVRGEARSALRSAAQPLISAIAGRAPVSDRPHSRYASKKNIKFRAPKGDGVRVATYYPGNLRRSIKILPLRRTKNVFIGPYLAKGSATGDFRGSKTDAYYAHMVEFGTKHSAATNFVTTAVNTAGPAALRLATIALKGAVEDIGKKNGFL